MKPKIIYGDKTTSYAFMRLLFTIAGHQTRPFYKPEQTVSISSYYAKYVQIANENELLSSLPYIRFKIESNNTRLPCRVGTVFAITSIDFKKEYVHAQAENKNFKIKFATLSGLTICDNSTPTAYVFNKLARVKKPDPDYVPQYDAKGQELQINQTVIYWDHSIEDYAVAKVTGFTQKYTAVYVETKALFSSSTYAKHTTKYPVSQSRYKNIKTRMTAKKLIVVDQDISDTVLEIILSA